MGKYVWPCPSYSRISSGYGNRVPVRSTATASSTMALTLAAASGVPILAFGPGTVTIVRLVRRLWQLHQYRPRRRSDELLRASPRHCTFQAGRESHRRAEDRRRWHDRQFNRLPPAFRYAQERLVGQSAELRFLAVTQLCQVFRREVGRHGNEYGKGALYGLLSGE